MSQAESASTSKVGQGSMVLPPNFRHNFVVFLVDYVFFVTAFSFISQSTVLPAFVRTLTDSEPLVGLVGTIFNACWLLPQLGVAAVISSKPRKKPYLIAATYSGRLVFLPLALAVWAGLSNYPAAMLAALFSAIALFALLDSVASSAWFDILARAMPVTRRGRLIGTGQFISSILGIGVGELVANILQSAQMPYPENYALLFGLSAVLHIPAIIALSVLREPEGEAGEPSHSVMDFLKQLGRVWRGDLRFRKLMSYRWLVGLMSLALPFYILHATEIVGLSEGATGTFISAQMVGGIAASFGMGWLSERKGPVSVIRVGAVSNLLGPVLALGIHFGVPPSLYFLVFFLLGFTNNTWLLGPINYVFEMATDEQRPIYMGLYNTLTGVLIPASLLGGFLLQVTSYPVLFGITIFGVAIGLGLSMSLQDP